jgi:hypothetical protein
LPGVWSIALIVDEDGFTTTVSICPPFYGEKAAQCRSKLPAIPPYAKMWRLAPYGISGPLCAWSSLDHLSDFIERIQLALIVVMMRFT